MLNLLRMDLYRLVRSKSVYICLALLMAMGFLCYGMVWLISTPQGQAAADKMGMTQIIWEDYNASADGTWESGWHLTVGPGENSAPLHADSYDTLTMFREISMDGGAYSCILGLLTALFVHMDFRSGYAKNILSLHRNRWKYAGSKILMAGILNFALLAFHFVFCLLLNLLFSNLVAYSGVMDTLFYLSWAWLNTTAFCALITFVCVLTRSIAAGITADLLLGSGLVISVLSSVTGLFNANGWHSYTLYFNLAYGPCGYTGFSDLKVYAVALAFLALYSLATALTLSRTDV